MLSLATILRFFMRILFEKVPVTQANCFIVREFRLPIFDTPLHVHPEFELTYIIRGKGKRVVGDSVVHYSAGDLVLIGSNVPHCWYSDPIATEQEALSHSIVVQFALFFWEQHSSSCPKWRMSAACSIRPVRD